MALADTYANTLLDTALTGTITMALFTSAPTGDTGGTELSGEGYARQTVAWNSSASKAATSNGAVTFPVATSSWGTVTHFALYVSTTRRLTGTLDTARAVGANDQLVFPTTTIVMSAA